ncbi:MAG: glycoside hydrolase family 26 protein [Chloroflexota bacterium]
MRRRLSSTLLTAQAWQRRFSSSRACVWAVALSVAVTMLSPGLSVAAELSRAPLTHGVYVPGGAQNAALLSAFEVQTGAPAGIVHWYQPWGASQDPWYQPALDVEALRQVTAHGALPLITWEATGAVASAGGLDPSRVRTIVGGQFDTYVDEWARGLKAFGKPVYLRPFHEMNNPAYAWAYGQSDNTAADEVAAWRYVHDRFAHIGASNVVWVWSPNTENTQVALSELYPGDGYVDWLGVDGYNGGTQLSWGGWLSPQQVFGRSYASLTALSPAKPIMIAETSSVEQGGSKADWIQELFRDLPAAFPNVRAIVWFQADTTARGEADWRAGTSQSALDAFRQSA